VLQSILHAIINSPVGAFGLLVLMYLVGRKFTKVVFDSPILTIIFVVAIFLLLKNIDALKSRIPIPNSHIKLVNSAVSAVQSEADYRTCLAGYIGAEPGNGLLQAAATDCEAKRSAEYWSCMNSVRDDYTIVDKSAYCVSVAGKVWTPCAELALSTKATTYTPVQNCASGMTIQRLRDAAGANTVK
jgi:hypothetical protein